MKFEIRKAEQNDVRMVADQGIPGFTMGSNQN